MLVGNPTTKLHPAYPQFALRETPRHKVRRVAKLRERINTLQKEVTQLQVRCWQLVCRVIVLLSCTACGYVCYAGRHIVVTLRPGMPCVPNACTNFLPAGRDCR